MKRKYVHIILFIIFFLSCLTGFYIARYDRVKEKQNFAKKIFSSYVEVTSKGISQGYFVWDEMYNAVSNHDIEFLNKNIQEIRSLFDFFQTVSIIERQYDGEHMYSTEVNDKGLFLVFGIFNSNGDSFIKDKVVSFKVDTGKIVEHLQFDKDYDIMLINNNVVHDIQFIYTKPVLDIINYISSFSISLLAIIILEFLRKLFIKDHYEVEGLQSIIKILSKKDDYTAKHSQGVADIACKIAEAMRFSFKDKKMLYKAALLHDIGKIGISEHILNKPGKLTLEEMSIIKKHPQYSYEIVSQFPNLRQVADIVIYHHEMMDGSGYPKGLTGDKIPVLSQILAVADVFNALTTDRPYRKKLSAGEAIKIMEGMPLNREMVGILRYIQEKEIEINTYKKKAIV